MSKTTFKPSNDPIGLMRWYNNICPPVSPDTMALYAVEACKEIERLRAEVQELTKANFCNKK